MSNNIYKKNTDYDVENDAVSEQLYKNITTKKRFIQIFILFVTSSIVLILLAIVHKTVETTRRGFGCNDTDIYFPYKHETIPVRILALYGTGIPFIAILIIECRNVFELRISNKKVIYLLSVMYEGLLFVLGMCVTLLITEILKRYVGRLRPHFMSVCNPNVSKIRCIADQLIDTDGDFCRGHTGNIHEARLSFPSGHSSFSFYTMGFLIFYLQFTSKKNFWTPIFQLAAFCIAFITSISRIPDFHHRGSDVVAGIVIGICVATLIGYIPRRINLKKHRTIEYVELNKKT